jgi:tRNA(fMet)-specific endonuclease VapC
MYLLDTDTVIAMLRGEHGVQQRVRAAGLDSCGISEITIAELYTGAFKSGIEKDFGQAEFAASFFRIYPIGETLKTYAQLRVDLERQGRRLDSMDLLIAATAMEHHLTLVTGNTRHFARIPDLVMEDWIVR